MGATKTPTNNSVTATLPRGAWEQQTKKQQHTKKERRQGILVKK